MRGWLPVHSHFGLELGLVLPRAEANVVAILAPAGDMDHLHEPAERPPFALRCDHRRPAGLVIVAANVAAPVARLEGVGARCEADRPELVRQQREGGAEAVVDPPAAVGGKAHPGRALERLALELGARAE